MTPERWSAIRAIFDAVVALDPDQRPKALEQGCAGDASLRAEVESILEHSARAPSFVDRPLLADGPPGTEVDGDDALVGQRAGAYVIVSLIASGGMGAVYRASRADDHYHKEVALKVVKRGMDSGEIVGRFRTERQILASLDHPHIVSLLDAGALEDGRPYLVMELVEGTPIDRYCEEHSAPTRARVALIRDVCAAVHHAHQRLLVHRDLKPGNILVTPGGAPKLLDFGIAKLLGPGDGDDTRTRPGWLPMTPRYASPEQLSGGPITTATDVFSLGVILRELLAGSRGDLEAITEKALDPDPLRRYGSAEQLSDDLGRYLAGLPLHAREGSRLHRAARFLRRNAWAVAAAGVVFVSLVVAATATWRGMVRARASERIAWRAHTQAVQAAALNHELLATIDADTLRGNRALLAQLEETSRRVDADLADLPEAQGRMRNTLAHTFVRLERWEEAEIHARRAASLAQTTRGFSKADQGAYLHLLGTILLARNDTEAIPTLEKALDIRARHHGKDHPRTVESREALADARSRLARSP
jgi:eukaryotic-like serine/threonine-protein kinase